MNIIRRLKNGGVQRAKINMILYFFIQSLLTILVFMAWIMLGEFSGGEVGMTPLTVLITISIQFVLASITYLAIKKISKLNPLIILIFYMMLYEIIFYIFTGNFALANIFNEAFSGAIYRGYSFSSIITGFITLILLYFFKVRKKA